MSILFQLWPDECLILAEK